MMPVAALDPHHIGLSVVSIKYASRARFSPPPSRCVLGTPPRRYPAVHALLPPQGLRPPPPRPPPFAEPSRSLFFSGAVVTAVCSAIERVRRVRQIGRLRQASKGRRRSLRALPPRRRPVRAVWRRDGGRLSPEPPMAMRRYGR
jgi:hypothetical protein